MMRVPIRVRARPEGLRLIGQDARVNSPSKELSGP
jgi:hypothetical protein